MVVLALASLFVMQKNCFDAQKAFPPRSQVLRAGGHRKFVAFTCLLNKTYSSFPTVKLWLNPSYFQKKIFKESGLIDSVFTSRRHIFQHQTSTKLYIWLASRLDCPSKMVCGSREVHLHTSALQSALTKLQGQWCVIQKLTISSELGSLMIFLQ